MHYRSLRLAGRPYNLPLPPPPQHDCPIKPACRVPSLWPPPAFPVHSVPLGAKQAVKQAEALRRKALQKTTKGGEGDLEGHSSGLGRLLAATKQKLHLPLVGGDVERAASGGMGDGSRSVEEEAGERLLCSGCWDAGMRLRGQGSGLVGGPRGGLGSRRTEGQPPACTLCGTAPSRCSDPLDRLLPLHPSPLSLSPPLPPPPCVLPTAAEAAAEFVVGLHQAPTDDRWYILQGCSGSVHGGQVVGLLGPSGELRGGATALAVVARAPGAGHKLPPSPLGACCC